MSVFNVFERRFRGFRVVEIGGLGVLLVLALLVYLLKTGAGDEREDIDHIQRQIGDEQARVQLLRAEVAKLEQPERLEALSTRYLNLQPIAPNHEIDASALASVAHAAPPPTPKAATTPTAAATDAPANTDADAKNADAKTAKAKTAPATPVATAATPPAQADDAARALSEPPSVDNAQ